jgi:copper chaperone
MERILLNVEGMSCSHCENRVMKALGAIDGVGNVSISLKDYTVTVDYDPSKVSPKVISEAVKEQGYQVK